MDCEVDQALARIAREREDLEKELEALSNELKASYARVAMGDRERVDPGVTEQEATERTSLDDLRQGADSMGSGPSADDNVSR